MNGLGQLNHPDLSDASRISAGRKYLFSESDTLNVAEVSGCSHGTWMAGITGATQNNSEGISGIAPSTGLIIMRVGYPSGGNCFIYTTGVLEGVKFLERYADDNPEKRIIANFSFGGPGSVPQVFQTIFDETYQNNVLVVVSAGNTSAGSVDSPAKLATKTPQSTNHFVSVGSSTHRDEISFKSAKASTNEEITLAAPAGPDSLIFYTWDYGTWLTDAITTGNPLDDSGNQAHTGTDYYRYAGLTSGAAAMTSGVAALIWSVNPTLANYQVKQILKNSADKVAAMGGQNYHNRFGYGRLNAYEALKYTLENYGGTLTQNLHIPSGETWNFDSGVTITFDDNADMIVEGTVSGGTFDFVSPASNNGVKFPTGSTGSISDCTIINATRAIEIASANPTISDCTLTDNTAGIWLTGGSNSSTVIENNSITDNSSHGIMAYYSSPTIEGNVVTGSTYGFMGVGSPAIFEENEFQDNDYGIYLLNNSAVTSMEYNLVSDNHFLGIHAESAMTVIIPFYNNMYKSSGDYVVSATNSVSVYGQNNYWGQYPPNSAHFYTASGGSIVYTPGASSAYTWKQIPGMRASGGREGQNEPVPCAEWLLEQFRKETDPSQKQNWLAGLAGCYISMNDFDGLNNILDNHVLPDLNETDDLYGVVLDIWGLLAIYSGEFEQATAHYTRIDESFASNPTLHTHALFALGYLERMQEQNIPAVGERYFTRLKEEYPQWGLTRVVEMQSGEHEDEQHVRKESLTQALTLSASTYPNPFNPSTVIGYELPAAGHVHLAVYDLLGREVAVLVNGQMPSGHHQAAFDGQNLSSGIYVYRLQTGEHLLTGKMMLMK
ncbi:MAG TPA: hypothetical protein DCE78_07460 [Bacteroidetes bacterium]|nr:hypothetical protein [Bacteroidota bacterium]